MFKDYKHKINSNADILLVHSPVWHIIEPNLGLAYVAQYFIDHNIGASYFDINNMLLKCLSMEISDYYWNPSNTEYWANDNLFYSKTINDFSAHLDSIADFIVGLKTEILGFSLNRTNRLFSIELLKRIKKKKPQVLTVCGGFLCGLPEVGKQFLDVFDMCVIGEGELTMLSIYEQFRTSKNYDSIPGVLTKKNISNFIRAEQVPIEKLGFPKYEFIELENYKNKNDKYSCLHLNVARGCFWGKCVFCQSAKISQGYRGRSFDSVIEEIEYLYNRNAKNFYFSDLAFGKDLSECEKFLNKIIIKFPEIRLSGQMRFADNLSKEFFSLMKKAGFHGLSFGLESGSQKILNKLKKGTTPKIAAKCLEGCHSAGLETSVFIIAGHPEETESNFYETFQFLVDNKQNISRVEQVCLFEFQYGTPAYDNLDYFIKNLGLRYPDVSAGENGNIFQWEIPEVNTMDIRIKRQQILYMLAEKIGLGKGHYSQQEDQTSIYSAPVATYIVRKLEKSKMFFLLKIYRTIKKYFLKFI